MDQMTFTSSCELPNATSYLQPADSSVTAPLGVWQIQDIPNERHAQLSAIGGVEGSGPYEKITRSSLTPWTWEMEDAARTREWGIVLPR